MLTAIRHRTTLDQAAAHGLLLPNSEHRLHERGRRCARCSPIFREAFDNAARIAAACEVSLDFSDVRFPGYPVPAGETPFSVLYSLCQELVQRKYHPMTSVVAARLQRELDVIEKTHLAEFFLITWDIMRFAREHGIPGQGRGSAADSIVAYLLGITRVDPVAHDLLFERFLHEDHQGTPDIDIDFSTDHREQVLQYVYEKYGADRTGMVANVVTFRPRMAIRQVGLAMGFPETLIDKLGTHTHGWYMADIDTTLGSAAASPSSDIPNPQWLQYVDILRRIEGTPRHLSIHVGGMLVTGEPLVDVVPVERATMPGRVVVQFDKDDVEDLGLIKMDLLGLRTLSAIAECLDLIEQTTGTRPDLDELPLDDQRVFDVICKVDTIGLFQIELRAQQQSLWQSQPRCFNDLIVQVAIIRPGPIQGDAVHPYLRRRQGLEPVTYLHPKLEPILAETCGVVLYQEQILRIVMEIAAYTAGEADRFRRAMNRHRSRVEMEELRDGFIRRCIEHDLSEEVAQQIFKSVAGFAEFGFCKSHAAAFARTAYETAWLRMTYPGALHVRAAQRAADGLLPSVGPRRRRQTPRGARAARRRHPEPRPLHRRGRRQRQAAVRDTARVRLRARAGTDRACRVRGRDQRRRQHVGRRVLEAHAPVPRRHGEPDPCRRVRRCRRGTVAATAALGAEGGRGGAAAAHGVARATLAPGEAAARS